MKRVTILLVIVLLSSYIRTQTVLEVAPGFGTLNDAIAANKGNVVYQLKAGQWYGLSATIENADFNLTIIGEKPSSAEIMPAMLQIGSDATGTPLPNMFNLFNNLTIKNIFIVHANENHIQARQLIRLQNSNLRVIIDNVVMDPLGSNNCIVAAGTMEHPKIYFTNNLVLRSGQRVSPNDGTLFQSSIAGDQINQFDTLYIENNTFVNSGTWTVANLTSNINGRDNFVWLNHNSFIIHKSQLDISYYEKEYYFTNNLMFNFNTQPYNLNWNVYYPDAHAVVGEPHSRLSLINADTLQGETLPSTRTCFVEYNANYRDPRFDALPSWGLSNTKNFDGVTPNDIAYLMPLYYTKEFASVNREANMFGSAAFPNFKSGNTYEVDPQFKLTKIYELSDSLVAWTLPAAQQHTWGFDPAVILPVTQWPDFWWHADNSGMGNPTAWPRFDGTYTNAALLTGSIEKLPLGDLNWFPEAKAKWEANKATIQAHILGLNESQIELTDVENTPVPVSYSLSQNYPNPFNPSTVINFSIPNSGKVSLKIYNLLGQEMAVLIDQEMPAGNHQAEFNAKQLSTGTYFYKLNAHGFTLTKKMMLVK